MIPKVIHYCWFGGNPHPPIVDKCIRSWKKVCPDYEIIEWNEGNYDVKKFPYTKQAFEKQKWAFVSDYARLDIMYNYGGIYLDTDVELIKPLDALLEMDCFLASDGDGVATGLGFGAVAGHECVRQMMNVYEGVSFVNPNGSCNLTVNTPYNTKPFIEQGFDAAAKEIQHIFNACILPKEYFCPKNKETFEVDITENTYGIHWDSRLWETGMTRLKAEIRLLIGVQNTKRLKMFIRKVTRFVKRG